ncbi:TPA: transposase [Bacillus thuringiensis]|nr:transposase [Bacillus thuringiensis]
MEYKTKWYGKPVIVVSKIISSSQLCFKCKYKSDNVKFLSICK